MNKIFKLLLLASLIATAGCIKQKNCDCSMSGSFVYLKEPYKLEVGCFSKKQEIVAHFFNQKDIIDGTPLYITGNVPKEFQLRDTICVSICSQYLCEGKHGYDTFYPIVHKLKCIEMED